MEQHIHEIQLSPLYSSTPLYVTDQPDFLNFVLSGKTKLSPKDLLTVTQHIEAKYGRNRDNEIKKGPRTLDIDILLYGNEQITSEELTIPHPGITERAFVLVPLLRLAPDLKLPGDTMFLKDYYSNCKNQGIYETLESII